VFNPQRYLRLAAAVVIVAALIAGCGLGTAGSNTAHVEGTPRPPLAPPSCAVGFAGTAAVINVEGQDARSACRDLTVGVQSDKNLNVGDAYLIDKPSGSLTCRHALPIGLTYTVYDQGSFMVVSTELCRRFGQQATVWDEYCHGEPTCSPPQPPHDIFGSHGANVLLVRFADTQGGSYIMPPRPSECDHLTALQGCAVMWSGSPPIDPEGSGFELKGAAFDPAFRCRQGSQPPELTGRSSIGVTPLDFQSTQPAGAYMWVRVNYPLSCVGGGGG